MKNTAILILILLTSVSGFTQSKVGTVDIDLILSRMPELTQVNENLTEYASGLEKQLQEKMSNYQTLLDTYNASIDSFTAKQMQEKQSEIIVMEEEITKFQQNGIQLIRLREDELKRPLFQKIAASMEKVAKANNYTQILSLGDNNTVVYLEPAFDISFLIIADLGIVLEE